ncbi:MAG: hypothetical protein HZA23_04460 [Nitrospirae bacterium]|nr:hypothetical protein [Nitrospirota bacterium]
MKRGDLRTSRFSGVLILLIAPLLMGTTWIGVPLEESADAIVLLIPQKNMALHVPMRTEQVIQGKIIKAEKGQLPPQVLIIHTPNTITTPLEQGLPHELVKFLVEII